MDQEQRNRLLTTYRDGLLDDVLPFWIRHCVDPNFGGFITSLDQDGSIVDTDKNVWQQGRFTWLLGELYNNVRKEKRWLQLALNGAQFIDQYCFDLDDGRMWFHLTREGEPIRKRRYAYSESFAAIAYGELFKATRREEFAEKAANAFQQFLSHNLNPSNTEPKFTATRPVVSIGFPMIALATAQELRDSIGLETAEHWIDQSIQRIRTLHVKEELNCVLETVGPDGEVIDHFDGRTLNPGHAIEAAWFIMQEGKHRSDQKLINLGCKMLDWSWQRGWDQQYGGILYFVDLNGLPVQEYWHDMKFWWPQNEAMIATLLAYQLTGNEKYARWHLMIHDWAVKRFADPEHGEWFGYLHRDGTRSSSLKGNHWKGPFHLPRMQLKCWQILEEMEGER